MSKATLQTVDKALELIDIMAHTNERMSALEMSKALNISRTSIYALINSLESKKYIEQDSQSGKYHLGYKLLELGSYYRYQYPFVTIAEKSIYALSHKWQEQINLAVYKKPCLTVFLLVKAPEKGTRTVFKSVYPAYTNAAGKLLLSILPDDELYREVDSITFRKFAPNTITDKESLLQDIHSIRQCGYAVEREENLSQKGCIAAPIRDISGSVIASLSITVGIEDLNQKFEEYKADIVNAALNISLELGYNPYND